MVRLTDRISLTEIVEKVRGYQPQADFDLVNRAYVFSAQKHEGQKRKSGEPYFTHPVSVANIIAEMKLDSASVCAALLHDVLEDTDVTTKQMEEIFGEEVSFLVDGVTKLGKINFTCKEDQQAESFRKMLVAMARDIRVLLVKLADRLDNMRTLEHMKPEAQARIAQETLEIYAPLAGRLGINWLKSELEDLSFRYLYPEAYVDIIAKSKKVSRDQERYISDVCKRLQKMLIERGFAAECSGRMKHLYSIYRKMRQNNCEFEQVHDVLAFRVLVENVADCYAALGVIHSQWTPIPGRFKDYIALPKPNMYQSLHTTVIGPGQRRIEVQIRTDEMHKTAENGIAAHWKYKDKSGGPDAKDAARFAWLRQLMEFQQEVADPAEFLDSVKVDLFADEVYVFTPKGQLKVFPRGATPIDFAYSVHSEVGDHCAGARVNGAIVPLRYTLHNGDTVEIITSPQQHPSKDWLDFVQTGRARSRIRTYIRSEERRRSIKLGKDLVERAFHKKDMSFARFLKSGEAERVSTHFKVQSPDELFAAVGYGRVSAGDVYDAAIQDEKSADALRPSFIERTVRRVTGSSSAGGIRIDDVDDVLVRFAQCCQPLPGDPITGWITRGRGVTVHRRGCPKAMELDPERRIDVAWSEAIKIARPVALRIITSDRPGILANVSAAFTEAGVNIQEANCRVGPDGQAVNLFQFLVDDAGRLQNLMRRIQGVEGVYSVERA
ncbi:RelA/SpoT family protein [Sandaracinus amylolyticus]|uniref:GTP pyrophosphokinase n=1 Tax=Sandaracinus amylolyticus TaxID=927083 RepID=A0A0F6W969_9BACT|nr:bifunctional (p)ppGpp synthetase/guanosine-3',5'-bis(diphosphate) 3'-pyrophosphohydrolase [Sandaracinus amylolyticus]AKF10598.1 GTP pyrophosphokinase [Sandaracinus amylolyticus]